jgi:hypothetical protein
MRCKDLAMVETEKSIAECGWDNIKMKRRRETKI